MALLPERDRRELAKRFRGLARDVTVAVFTQEQGPLGPSAAGCSLCREPRELAGDLAAASGRVHLEVHDLPAGDDIAQHPAAAGYGIERVPALVLLDPGRRDAGIRF